VVADLVMSRIMQASAPPAASQQTLVDSITAELQGGNFHGDFIEGIAKAVARVEASVEQRITNAVNGARKSGNEDRAVDIVRGVIAEYAEADPSVGYSSESIYNTAIQKFMHDPSLAMQRAAFNSGKIDRAFWMKLAKDEVVTFCKVSGRDTPSKGLATKPAAASTGAATPPADATPKDASGLSSFGRERYESFKALAVRSGKTPEQAHETAMTSAKRFK
jgi:hypothetical protein